MVRLIDMAPLFASRIRAFIEIRRWLSFCSDVCVFYEFMYVELNVNKMLRMYMRIFEYE